MFGSWLSSLSVVTAAMFGAASVKAEEVLFRMEIRQGALTAETNTLRATKGDVVAILWTTDRATRLHLHGYDVSVDVNPASPVEMRFDATISGRFPVEAHGTAGHTVMLYVEVHPE